MKKPRRRERNSMRDNKYSAPLMPPQLCRCITFGSNEHVRGIMGCYYWNGGSVPRNQ